MNPGGNYDYKFIYQIVTDANGDEYLDDNMTLDMWHEVMGAYKQFEDLSPEDLLVFNYWIPTNYSIIYIYERNGKIYKVNQSDLHEDMLDTVKSNKHNKEGLNLTPIITEKQLRRALIHGWNHSDIGYLNKIKELEYKYEKASIFGLKHFELAVEYQKYMLDNFGIHLTLAEWTCDIQLTSPRIAKLVYLLPLKYKRRRRLDLEEALGELVPEAELSWRAITSSDLHRENLGSCAFEDMDLNSTIMSIESHIIGDELYIPSFIKNLTLQTNNSKLKLTGGHGVADLSSLFETVNRFLQYLDLSEFDMSNITDMRDVIKAPNLKTINFGKQDVTHVSFGFEVYEMYGHFHKDLKLTGSKLSESMVHWNETHQVGW